jgi:hypothetical protein
VGLPVEIVIYPDRDEDWRHAMCHEQPCIGSRRAKAVLHAIRVGRLHRIAQIYLGATEYGHTAVQIFESNGCGDYEDEGVP